MKENKRFKKGALAAAVFSTAMLASGCSLIIGSTNAGVYGPEAYSMPNEPESEYSNDISKTESKQPESISEPEQNSFWVEDNINEEVYGPPPLDDNEISEEVSEESSQEEISEESEEDTFQVEDNSNVAVYGPPPTT